MSIILLFIAKLLTCECKVASPYIGPSHREKIVQCEQIIKYVILKADKLL